MGKLSLSYAGHVSDRVKRLYDGDIAPEGIDLHFIPLSPVQAFNRMLRGEFDCGEMSFSTYIIKTAAGDRSFVAIPVFPSRTFRHGAIYINKAAGISAPEDLIGKTIGVPEYGMTAAVWARGALKSEFGITPQSINWVTGGLQAPGRRPLVSLQIQNVSIRHEESKGLNQMLLDGDIDALIAPQVPPALMQNDPRVGYLFTDVRAAERDYFRKTGVFPIMHAVVVRRDVYERNPWVLTSLMEAFEKAKAACLEELSIDEPLPISLPGIVHYVNEVRATFGDDYWPYGVERNIPAIEALCYFLHDQGIVDRRVSVEDLFPESLAALKKIQL
jgi:4,5-dihydroxyphthalate decarboxylase